MNPQYLPQAQFGGPPQNFPPNRASPSLTSQPPHGFQNVPLGIPKPGQVPTGPFPGAPPGGINHSGSLGPPPMSMGQPPTNVPGGQLPSNPPTINAGGPVPRTQIPSSQLPPSQLPHQPDQRPSPHINPFAVPPSKPGGLSDMPPTSNGTPQFQNGPPHQIQNGPPLGQHPPSTQQNKPPSAFAPTVQNSFGGSQPHIQFTPGQTQNQPGAPPLNQDHPPRPGSNQPNQFGPPPLSGGPPSLSGGQPPLSGGPPPLSGGPPPLSGGPPPLSGGPPPLSGGPPPLSGGPPPLSGGPPPLSGGPPSLSGGPPSLSGGPPPLSGGPPSGNSQIPPNQFRQPPLPGGTQSQFGQASVPGMPPRLNQPQNQFNQPPNQFNQPPNQFNQPPLQSGPPPGQNLPPNQFSHGSLPGGPQRSGPPMQQPPLPAQNFPGQVPMPGQNPAGNFPGQPPKEIPSGPYPTGNFPVPQPGAQYNQQFNGPNQLTNQMQGMNLSGPRQYPTGGMKSPVSSGGPHMPPPINQQGYMNGQQARGPPAPGYPPMPAQGAAPVGAGGYPQPAYQQPQQARRLDPDQMPSPVQVTQDDQQNRSGVFVTNQKGLVPPLVTTKFTVQDQGNASPRYVRSTMYNVPISQDIIKQTAVPFSLVINPMARTIEGEYPPPIVNFGEVGPIRCIRCKAYMCPYMQFIDSGRRFQCLFCRVTTDVPSEYFQHLDHTGQRMDRYERPELVLGTYEFVATADYCRNNTLPKPPAVIFIIDVSYNNIKSGLVNLLCSQMKEIIQNLPIDQGQEKSNMRVGFITYNSSVHFYNIKGTLAAPQMMVVGDVQEMFMPLLDGFLCTPEESGPIIDALMQQIPTMFGDTRETETVLLPAIQAGLEALKASDCSGKLMVFHSTLPTAEAPGKLKNRDDRKLLGTEKEKTVLIPQTQAYNQLGQDCVGAGCSVDLFIFNNAYIDIATIGQVSRLTGGEVFKYTYFQADIDGERLINDIVTDISRPVAFDAIMRVRTSTGVRPTDFYGHFYMSNTTDMELASIDCDKAIALEIKYDDKLSEDEGVYIQAALLYTSCSGQRRLRIINLSLKTCSQMADLYRSCDLDTIINYISKQAVYKLLEHNPKAIKDSIVNRAAQILATYRKNCANPSSAGQLILPECMKLLPLYVNCLLKSDALSGGSEMTIDDRSFAMQAVLTMDICNSVYYFYPRLIPLHDLDPTQEPLEIPQPIRCTLEKMNEQGVYILENGIHMFLWFGLGVSPDFIQKVFGAPSAIQVDIERIGLPELDNSLSLAVRSIIDKIRIERHRYMRLTLVRQREKMEAVFKHFLVEDRGTDGSPSYVDFLCHMHKEIRTLLS